MEAAATATHPSNQHWWTDLRKWAESHRVIAVLGQMAIFYGAVLIFTLVASDRIVSYLTRFINIVLSYTDLPPFHFVNVGLVTFYATLAVLVAVAALTLRWFVVHVPKFMALLMTNYFDNSTQKLGAGAFLKNPWQLVEERMWFSIEVFTFAFVGKFMTKNGGQIYAGGFLRYSVSFENLERYAQMDEASVGIALIGDVQQVLIEEISKRRTQEVAGDIDEIRKEILSQYRSPAKHEDRKVNLGVCFEDMMIDAINPDDKTQNALTALLESEVLFVKLDKDGKPILGADGKPERPTDKEREDILILLNKEGVKKTITETRVGGEGSFKDLHPVLLAAIQKFVK